MDKAIRIARKEAAKAGHEWAHHAVIVFRGGNPVATGHNHGHLHAEFNALNSLWPKERRGTTVLSIRVTKSGKLSMARPCPKCYQFMLDNGVKNVVYSDSNGELVKERVRKDNDFVGTRYQQIALTPLKGSAAKYYASPPWAVESGEAASRGLVEGAWKTPKFDGVSGLLFALQTVN